jgi:aspartate ammonia-lyase
MYCGGVAAFKASAVSLSKMPGMRLLGFGPRGGIGEIRLPAVQARLLHHSQGKVNPVICEAVNRRLSRSWAEDFAVPWRPGRASWS